MKKFNTLFFIASLLFAGTIHAQINKGATFLGGDISGSINSTKQDGNQTSKSEGITFSPAFGKAIRQNLILGFDAVVHLGRTELFANPDARQRGYGIGMFMRKYSQLGKGAFSLFLQGRLGGVYQTNILNTVQRNESKTIAASLSAYPGLSYRISRRLQLETGFSNLLSLSYNRTKTIGTPSQITQKSTNLSLNTSLNNISELYAGFRLLIN
jgi:hypothetical protein